MATGLSLRSSSSRRWLSDIILLLLLLGGSFTSLELIYELTPWKLMIKGAVTLSLDVPHQQSITAPVQLRKGPEVLGLDHTRRVMASSSAMLANSSELSNLEVDALMEFRNGVVQDPRGVFLSWDYSVGSGVCSWTGVSCTNTTTGRVTALDLSNQQLSGTLSPSLAGLEFLSYVNLSNNFLTGIIPDKWGALQNLAVLNLSSNGINGTIPSSISNCSSLTMLDLSKNLLTGDLTSLDWRRLGGLEVLSLGRNNLSGDIPEALGGLQKLQYLYVHNNSLSGKIPSSMGNCSALAQVDLKYNFLRGELPLELGRLQLLEYLYLEFNMLSGQIPSSLGLLSHLSTLHLSSNNLTGTIPASLGNCSSLEVLDVSRNALSGNIPKQLFQLPKVRKLYLYGNELVGAIDPSIGNCTALEEIAIGTNYLSGSIPPELGLLKNLDRANFFQNSLTGIIPPEIGNCSSMYDYSVRGNHLTGAIPASFGRLLRLQALRLGENFLTGFIPPELAKCKKLAILGLFSNRLSGPIPQELGQLQFLSSLNLSDNLLTGSIPSSLANCISLTELNLASNKLTGHIPSAVLGRLTQLQIHLNLSRNELSGPISAEIGLLISVQIIDLSFNNLSGAIPTDLESCKGLRSLDLSSNNLQGMIPATLSTLSSLHDFNVSFNQLTGSIPDNGIFLNFTNASYIGNPDLCGKVVDRECSLGSGENSTSCQETQCHHTQIIIAAAVLGSVLVVMIVLGVVCYLGCTTRVRPQAVPLLIDELTREFCLSMGDIRTATGRFSEANIVGVGAKSTVYKGVLPGGMQIAVKKMERSGYDKQSIRLELHRELQSLGALRHRNLLRVYDFCSTDKIDALVLEYMPKGSLWRQLHEEMNCPLNFDQRLEIAIGVSEALVYLHYECPRPIIHLDLKSSNILLDEELVPKVADFGISRFVRHDSDGEASVSSSLHGTIGYIPPEYGASTNVSTRGDVYSFGVVLFELITRKQPTDVMFSQSLSFRQWVMDALTHNVLEIIDKSLLDKFSDQEDQLGRMLQVGLLCTLHVPSKRPTMKDVRELLIHIKARDNIGGDCPSWDHFLCQDRIGGDHFGYSQVDRSQRQYMASASTFSSSNAGYSIVAGALLKKAPRTLRIR